jgi:hypothetical protein
MDRRLAAGELDHLRIAFSRNEVIENIFDLFQSEIEAWSRIGKAKRTRHIARAVDFDDAQAGVLLMIGAQPAIVWAAGSDFG